MKKNITVPTKTTQIQIRKTNYPIAWFPNTKPCDRRWGSFAKFQIAWLCFFELKGKTLHLKHVVTFLFGTKYSRMVQVKFFKCCLPQISLGLFLNTLYHISLTRKYLQSDLSRRVQYLPYHTLGLNTVFFHKKSSNIFISVVGKKTLVISWKQIKTSY